jgi:predicted metal-dependent hydrolase
MELGDDGGLVVVAPRHWSRASISATLARNTGRIERFLARARARQLEPLRYAHGQAHLYLGDHYPLLIDHEPGARRRIDIVDSKIRIVTPSVQHEKIQALLQHWYQREAKTVFTARLAEVCQRAHWVGDRHVPLTLRRMKRTWGNCSSGGVIKLNTHLIKAPLEIIDSVIAHELCHLEEMNHGRAFYSLLEKLNPDWRQDRARLRLEGPAYLLT